MVLSMKDPPKDLKGWIKQASTFHAQQRRCSAHIFPMLADTAFAPNDLYPMVSARNPFHPCSIRC
jgi:hypothetical protein